MTELNRTLSFDRVRKLNVRFCSIRNFFVGSIEFENRTFDVIRRVSYVLRFHPLVDL